MKSSRQRREEIQRERLEKKAAERAAEARQAEQDRARRIVGTIAVNIERLRPYISAPDFVARGFYVDRPFTCKDCGVSEIWTARQQKWWYESAQGALDSIAIRCRPCRHRERARKTAARKIHLEGLAKKQRSA